jgi:hypothetical protein
MLNYQRLIACDFCSRDLRAFPTALPAKKAASGAGKQEEVTRRQL